MSQDDESTDDGSVLSPEELDITDDENVTEIDDGRYVISPEEDGESGPPEGDGDFVEEDEPELDPDPVEPTEEDVREWLAAHVGESDCKYGFDVTASFEGSVRHRELFSDDVTTTFENLITWYAKHVGGDTPVDEALGILLMEATIPVRYPEETVGYLVSKHDLDADDSIADLLSAVEGGVRFPP